MKPGLFTWLTLCLLTCSVLFVNGQQLVKNDAPVLPKADTLIELNYRITKNDETNIKSRAERVVKRFMDLLVFISTGLDLEVPEMEKIIQESYSHPENKIFNDSTTLIEDDLRPLATDKMTKEKPVVDYLKDFDLLYKKNSQASVTFSNIRTSNIKKGQFLYIKVFYDCLFSNKSRISDEDFTVQKRVAELKLEKQDNKWRAYIIDVHFLNSRDADNALENDIAIAEDSQTPANTADTQAEEFQLGADKPDLTSQPVQESTRKENDSVRTYMSFRNLVDSGNRALNNRNYVSAYQFYNEAEIITKEARTVISRSDVAYLQSMIQQARKNIDVARGSTDEQYNQYMKEALFAENAKRYNEALENYTLALSKKPEEVVKLSAKIQELTLKVNTLSQLEEKYMAGKYKEAINEYEKAIKKDPTNTDYLIGRGKSYERIQEYGQALKDYKRAIQIDPYNVQAYKMKAALHEIQGAYADALSTYATCAQLEKNNVGVLQKVAWLNVTLGNTPAAIEALDRALLIDNKVALLHNLRGELLFKTNNAREAELSFSNAIQIDSSKGYLFYSRGLAEVSLRKIALAGQDFAKAKKLGLDSSYRNRIQQIAAEFYKAGLAHYDAGRTDSALASVNDALALDAGNTEYMLKRGELYFKLNDLSKAIQSFDEAALANPNSYQAYKNRGMVHYIRANYTDAVTDFTSAIKLDPKIPQTYKYLGDAYLQLKKFDNATSSYDAALSASNLAKPSLDDDFLADLFNKKGEAYFQSGNYQAALDHFEVAIKKNRYIRGSYFNRGKTYLRLNQLDKAQEDLEKAIEKTVESPEWYFTLGELYQRRGKFTLAIYQYNFTLSARPPDSMAVLSLYNRARCFVNMNNYTAALNDFKTLMAGKGETRFPNLNTEIGDLYIKMNNPDSALLFLNNAVKDSSNSTAVYLVSVAYARKKQSGDALLWLEKALTRMPGKLTRDTVMKDFAYIKDERPFQDLMNKYFGTI